MAHLFRFEVYTPNRLFFADSVEAIILTLIDGEAAVYANHALLSAPVTPCLLKIKSKDGHWKIAFTSEGILEVTNHKTVLVSDAAEWPDEIDHERALTAKKRAEETIEAGQFKYQTEPAAISLHRANMRIKAWNAGKEKN